MSVNIVTALVKQTQSQPPMCIERMDGSTAGVMVISNNTSPGPGLGSSRRPGANADHSPGPGASVERPLEVAYVCVLGAMQVDYTPLLPLIAALVILYFSLTFFTIIQNVSYVLIPFHFSLPCCLCILAYDVISS